MYFYNKEITIRTYARYKHLPKYIINKKKELQVRKESKFRKLKNKELNSKLGSLEYNSEKTQKISKSDIIKK